FLVCGCGVTALASGRVSIGRVTYACLGRHADVRLATDVRDEHPVVLALAVRAGSLALIRKGAGTTSPLRRSSLERDRFGRNAETHTVRVPTAVDLDVADGGR